MRQLSPGDVVHIRDNLRNAHECNSGLLESMKNMAGEWVTILGGPTKGSIVIGFKKIMRTLFGAKIALTWMP